MKASDLIKALEDGHTLIHIYTKFKFNYSDVQKEYIDEVFNIINRPDLWEIKKKTKKTYQYLYKPHNTDKWYLTNDHYQSDIEFTNSHSISNIFLYHHLKASEKEVEID